MPFYKTDQILVRPQPASITMATSIQTHPQVAINKSLRVIIQDKPSGGGSLTHKLTQPSLFLCTHQSWYLVYVPKDGGVTVVWFHISNSFPLLVERFNWSRVHHSLLELGTKMKEAGRRMCWAYKNIFTFVPFYGHKKTTKTFRVTQCCIMRVLCDSLPLLCMKLNTYVGVAADRDASPACLNHLPSSHTYTHTHRHAYKRAHAGRQQTFSFCHSGGMQSVTWPHHQPGG